MAERLLAGDLPLRAQAALSTGGIQVKEDPPAQCVDCPLSTSYADRSALALRLEHAGCVFGWMCLSCSAEFAHSVEEHDLIKEVAGDIAYALWAIETETQRGTLDRISERKKAEKTLKESERHLRSTIDGLSAHIAVLDERGEIILTNKAYRDFGERNGVDPGAVSEGANYLSVCETASGRHSEEAGPFADGIRDVLSGKRQYFELEYPCHSPDEKRWFIGRVTSINGERPRRAIVAHENITERRQAEEELRESEKKYRMLIENQTDLVVHFDLEKRILFASSTYCETFGKSENELVGTKFLPFVHEDDRPLVAASLKMVLSPPHKTSHEERALTVNGWRWFAWSAKAVLSAEGHAASIISVGRDITERKRAEEDRNSALSLLDAALESTEDGILVVDRVGKVIKLNQKFLDLWRISPELDLSDDEQLLRHIVGQLADPEGFLSKVKKLYDAPEAASFDEVEFSDGRIFERYSQPQRLNEKIVGRAWSFRDITSRKRAEAKREKIHSQLIQAQKMESVGRLAGGVAHDYNNMLGVILGHTELALEISAPDDPLRHHLQEILAATRRSAGITRKLLAFSRQQPISPKALDLNETIESMLKMLRRLIGEDITFSWQPGAHSSMVFMDPTQVDQVLVNLCVNARDAIDDVGKISIETDTVSFDQAYCAKPRLPTGRFRVAVGQRRRLRHESGNGGKDFRAVFHHQANRQGHRSGVGHGVRHRQTERRLHQRVQ
jgi:PAS domain S-box-containing protein